MVEYFLNTSETAELLGITERAVQKNIASGKYNNVMYVDGARGGKSGKIAKIAISSLPIEAQSKYMASNKLIEEPERIVSNEYDCSARWQREIANSRYQIIKQYELYIAVPGKKTILTDNFITAYNEANPNDTISKSTLYNWQRAYKKEGLMGLLTGYGKRKQQRTINDEAWEFFCGQYLQLTRPSIGFCYRLLELKSIEDGWEIPSLKTIARMAKQDIPEAVRRIKRYGEKNFYDNSQAYTKRDYESISAGEVYVGDHHVFDLFINVGSNEKPKWTRPWLTAWMDMRSRKLVGWTVNLSPCTDQIIAAFAKAALNPCIGLPRNIYIDNGRDYCSHKFAGRGNRGKRLTEEDKEKLIEEGKRTATLMERLKIETNFAIVENARAKVVEREFRNIVEWFSKPFPTYCGRNAKERPEDLEKKLKQPKKYGVGLEEFKQIFNDWVLNVFNKQVSQGAGREGECPDETFMRTRLPMRTADPSVMRLFFMRSTNPFKIGRNGVSFKGNEYYMKDSILKKGQAVYVRYNEENLDKIWLYTTKDEYLGEAEKIQAIAAINADSEDIARDMRRKAIEKKAVLNHSTYQATKKVKALDPTAITELHKLYGNIALDVTPNKVVEMVTLPKVGKEAVALMKATGTDGINPFEIISKAKIEKRKGDF